MNNFVTYFLNINRFHSFLPILWFDLRSKNAPPINLIGSVSRWKVSEDWVIKIFGLDHHSFNSIIRDTWRIVLIDCISNNHFTIKDPSNLNNIPFFVIKHFVAIVNLSIRRILCGNKLQSFVRNAIFVCWFINLKIWSARHILKT